MWLIVNDVIVAFVFGMLVMFSCYCCLFTGACVCQVCCLCCCRSSTDSRSRRRDRVFMNEVLS